jgi:CheY-like chemotaxis protein
MQDAFAQQVRDLLDHLYDYEYLQETPLAHAMDPEGDLLGRERMRLLRSTLLASMEDLNPGDRVSPYSLRVRSYNVLTLHYVDRLTIQQVAHELALSERQVYRDLRQAEQDLADVFWSHLQRQPGPSQWLSSEVSRAELALRELGRLPDEHQAIDVRALVEGAIVAVKRLAEQRGVVLRALIPADIGSIRAERQTVRQVLVSILSYIVQHAKGDTTVRISGEQDGDRVRLEFGFSPEADDIQIPQIVKGFIEQIGGHCALQARLADDAVLSLTLIGQRPYHVLVIDDNEGLVALFQRYLMGEQYRVVGAADGIEGLDRAKADAPDVIVLDVLIPGQDGWEILQQLKTIEVTQSIPVILCSVLEDPDLAYSLGATGFLAKPVSRQQLLQELSRCCPQP